MSATQKWYLQKTKTQAAKYAIKLLQTDSIALVIIEKYGSIDYLNVVQTTKTKKSANN